MTKLHEIFASKPMWLLMTSRKLKKEGFCYLFSRQKGLLSKLVSGTVCNFVSLGAKEFCMVAIWIGMSNEVETSSRSPTGVSQILVKKQF